MCLGSASTDSGWEQSNPIPGTTSPSSLGTGWVLEINRGLGISLLNSVQVLARNDLLLGNSYYGYCIRSYHWEVNSALIQATGDKELDFVTTGILVPCIVLTPTHPPHLSLPTFPSPSDHSGVRLPKLPSIHQARPRQELEWVVCLSVVDLVSWFYRAFHGPQMSSVRLG